MTTIYISKKEMELIDDLRICLIVKKKHDIKKAELFVQIIKEGVKSIKKKEGV